MHHPNKCVVLCPYHHNIEIPTSDGLNVLAAQGYQVRRMGGCSAIDAARNEMAADACKDGFEDMLWVDSDIVFNPNDVKVLADHQLPIICGAYVKKDRSNFAHNFSTMDKVAFGKNGGLVQLNSCGFGFVLVKTAVFDIMKSKLKLPYYVRTNREFGYPWFQPMIVTEHDVNYYLSEDYAFCWRARQCNFNVMCDTRVMVGHIGQYVFSIADLAHMIMSKNDVASNSGLTYESMADCTVE